LRYLTTSSGVYFGTVYYGVGTSSSVDFIRNKSKLVHSRKNGQMSGYFVDNPNIAWRTTIVPNSAILLPIMKTN
jgi:hypothetical protein